MSASAPGVWGKDPEARPRATTVEATLAVDRADVGVLLYPEAGVVWSRDALIESEPASAYPPDLAYPVSCLAGEDLSFCFDTPDVILAGSEDA